MTVGDIISRDNSDASISVSAGQTLWHPNLDIQTGHTYSIAGQMVLVDELTGAGTVDGDGTVFDTSTDLTGYSRLDRNESVTGGKTFSQRIEALGGINVTGAIFSPAALTINNLAATYAGGLYPTNLVIQDFSLANTGTGGGIQFVGYTNAGASASTFGEIKSYKENATAGDSSSAMKFSTNRNGVGDRLVLSLGSDLSAAFTGLIDISASTAGQIKFPATQNASSDANTLDDYEEFTFTATVQGLTTAGTYSYAFREGSGTKIGNRVSINIFVSWSSTGSDGSGDLIISGLPFTVGSFSAGDIGYLNNIALNANSIATAYADTGNTYIRIAQYATGGGGMSPVPIDHNGGIILSMQYRI